MHLIPVLVAIVGHPSAGKDTAADYLVTKYGFIFQSASDAIRARLPEGERGSATRARVGELARSLRKEHGDDFLVKEAISAAKGAQRLAIGGLRAIPEAQAIRAHGGKIICIEAPAEVRYSRSLARQRPDDRLSYTEFLEIERRESTGVQSGDQNLSGVIAMADFVVTNDGSKENLFSRLDKVITAVGLTLERS